MQALGIMAAACATVAVFFGCVQNAEAHGPHRSLVSPAWPCTEFNDGQIAVTHDGQKDKYVKYRCTCIWTEFGYRVCYWQIVDKATFLSNIKVPSNTRNYYQARIQERRVKWLAQHGDDGCFQHYARKLVIVIRHK